MHIFIQNLAMYIRVYKYVCVLIVQTLHHATPLKNLFRYSRKHILILNISPKEIAPHKNIALMINEI